MNSRKPIASALSVLALGLVLAACGAGGERAALPQGSEPVVLKPADFTTEIDNPYWPMSPGSRWVYAEGDAKGTSQRVVVEATTTTKRIANGIEARVIRDTVSEQGVPVEVTDDWYAQDKDGNIWYLGEYVTNYRNGKVVDHAGSFEAGVDGAQPGIAMPANPEPGLSYRQEYYKGEAEDRAAVVTVGEEQVEAGPGRRGRRAHARLWHPCHRQRDHIRRRTWRADRAHRSDRLRKVDDPPRACGTSPSKLRSGRH